MSNILEVRRSPRFVVRLWLSKTGIEFDPFLSDLEEVIMEGMDYVIRTMESIPKIQAVIYNPNAEEILFSNDTRLTSGYQETKVIPEPFLVKESGNYLKQHCGKCFARIQNYLRTYDKYMFLCSSDIEKEIDQFFEENREFDEYTRVCLTLFRNKN
jgi:dynein heavy chain